jgi:hypothetical protein
MALDAKQLEEMLVGNLRSYLADYKSSDELEAKRLQELCSTLNWFCYVLVRDHEKWNRFDSVDGVVALSVEVRSDNELALDGYIFSIWEKPVWRIYDGALLSFARNRRDKWPSSCLSNHVRGCKPTTRNRPILGVTKLQMEDDSRTVALYT